jgi:hypothetical protein
MHIEVLVEERSAKEVLEVLIPRIIGDRATFAVRDFNGKQALLRALPARLQGYNEPGWQRRDVRIVVLVDRDADDCRQLKAQLEAAAQQAGLVTHATRGPGQPFQVLTRIAIEELEAWYFGDGAALTAAYGIDPHLAHRAGYRDPDAVPGGTAEALERELQRVRQHTSGLRKLEAARTIAPHMDPARNRAHSFQVFRAGLLEMLP